MSAAIFLNDLAVPSWNSGMDRRFHRRYPISLELQFRMLGPASEPARMRSGRTLDISSSGILFRTNDPAPELGPIELVINWPFLLDGHCPLKLVARGEIVRNDGRGVAMRMSHYEMRTAGRSHSAAQVGNC